MKDRFAGQFEKTLSKVKWPSKDITLFGKLKQEWSNGVEELLELQEPYVLLLIELNDSLCAFQVDILCLLMLETPDT